MEGWLLLDVVVTEGAAVFELLASEDEALLIWGDAFLVLDFGLHVLNWVRGLNIEGDGLTSEGLNEDLHTTAEAKNQVEGWLLLDVVVAEGSAVFKLLSSEDEALLIWGDTFLVLDLSFDVFNRVRWLNIEGNGLTGEGLNEDLHTTTKSEDQVKSWLFLDVIVRKSATIFELFSSEDKALLIWGDTLLVLDLGLHVLNGVRGLDIKSDGLTSKSLNEDLHTTAKSED